MLIDSRFADTLGPPRADRRLRLGVFVGAALLIAYSILFRNLSHDESQYVAAIALMRTGWPYLDFAYLQTPLSRSCSVRSPCSRRDGCLSPRAAPMASSPSSRSALISPSKSGRACEAL